MPALEVGAEYRLGDYRVELAVHYALPTYRGTDVPGADPLVLDYVEGEYSHTLVTSRVRRLFRFGRNVAIGAAGGLGFIIYAQQNFTYEGSTGREIDWSDRSDLDFAIMGGASLDVRIAGPMFWTTRLESVVTTSDDSGSKPFVPGVFGHASTGLRLSI
jgi:hypothetical protein